MPYVDFSALKQRVHIEQAAELLGLPLKREGGQYRTACPHCQRGGDRAIVITPAKGMYFCFAANKGGDVIALTAHCMDINQQAAALYLADQFGTVQEPDKEQVQLARNVPATEPQKPPRATEATSSAPAPQKKGEREFDPEEYAKKLQYTEEVAALGISEVDAQRLGIGFASTGFHRGAIVFAIRNDDGTIAGFAGYKDGQIKFPSRWLPAKVVQLKRPA